MDSKSTRSGVAAAWVALAVVVAGLPAYAEDAPSESKGFRISGDLTVDLGGAIAGGTTRKFRQLDVLTITVDADFEKLAGWKGATGAVSFQNTSGKRLNEDIGALQGIDNIEVVGRRGRLYEAWLEQAFDAGSLKVGLIDLNANFYVTDSSGLLIAPQYGIGSEAAATGPGGPSIYPQTALAARLMIRPSRNSYVVAGVFNSHVGDPGDKGGVNTRFDDGVIEIAEAGWTGAGRLAIGAWRYSRRQDDLFDLDAFGDPRKRTSQGAYLLAEHVFRDGGEAGATVTGFLRAGTSDGDTGPFRASWQGGVLVERVFSGRPDSKMSFGLDQARLGDKFRAASLAGGQRLASAESHLEATYSDKLTEHLTVQPDLQYVVNPGGDSGARNAVIGLVRITASF